MNAWTYNNEPITEEMLKDSYGFVYIIENLETNRKYIGKKLLWFKKTRMVKGKKKRYLAPSDWVVYWGSNQELLEDIKKIGFEKFKRTILHWCTTKGECNYVEAKEQFERNVLLDENYYNDLIRCRIHSSHIKKNAKQT
jgi:RNA:NAD 2'-phosphotransferase (TPT1/KptA family)